MIALLIFPGICALAQTGEKLGFDEISQVIQTFEQLPPQDQERWLDQKWTQVSDARWLPVLEKLAARELILRQGSRPDLDPVAAVTKIALKRWYELDPQTGREAILGEVASPFPRFGEDGLGILPDPALVVMGVKMRAFRSGNVRASRGETGQTQAEPPAPPCISTVCEGFAVVSLCRPRCADGSAADFSEPSRRTKLQCAIQRNCFLVEGKC